MVLGHSGCGAVTATVDAFLTPGDYTQIVSTQSLRSIIDKLFVMVRGAALSLAGVHGDAVVRRPGYRSALINLAIALNAMATASMLQRELGVDHGDLGVAWGVYNLSCDAWARGWPARTGMRTTAPVFCRRLTGWSRPARWPSAWRRAVVSMRCSTDRPHRHIDDAVQDVVGRAAVDVESR